MMLNKRIANANIIITSIFFIFMLVTKVFANDLGTLKQYSDLLLISNNVYDTSPSDEGSDAEITPFGIPTDKGNSYTIAKVFTDPESGFDASIYVDQDGKAVVAFRGTEFSFSDLSDIETDLQILQRNGHEEEQYSAVRVAMDYASNNFSDITVTGHSLGGSLAQYASLYSGVTAVTFNSAPITTNSEALSYVVKPAGLYQSGTSPFKNDPSNIVNISSANDPMTLLNLLVEEVGKGGDPVDLYVALRRSKNPLFPTPHSTIERAKIRVSAYALVTLAQKYYGLDGVGVTSVIVGNRVRLESTTGHSISNLEVQYGELKEEAFLAGLLDDLTPQSYLAPYIPPEEGYIFEYVEFNSAPEENPLTSHLAINPNADLTDDIIADLVEEADPDDPVTPEPVLVGVFSGVNGTPRSNLAIQGTLSNVVEASTGNASFEITDECVSGCTVTGTTPEPEASSYSHLSWGRLSQTVRMTDTDTGFTHDIENMRWLYGDATSSDYLNTRTGTASYAGQIYGDFTEGGVTQYNTITGGIGLSFNFSDDSLSGQAYFSQNGVPQEGFDIAGGVINHEGQQHLQATLTSQDPNTSGSITSGGLLGTFYGPEANEVGGAIWAFGTASEHDEAFAVGGVFVASSGETFVMPNIDYDDTSFSPQYSLGYSVLTTENTVGQRRGGLVARTRSDGSVNVSTEDSSVNPVEGVITTISTGSFEHTAWGEWNNSGTYEGDSITHGIAVFGNPTLAENMPSSGTANFGSAHSQSQVAGMGNDGSVISGSVALTAEFGSVRSGMTGTEVTGTFDFDRNGQDWVNGSFSSENDVLRSNQFSADMNVDQGGAGRMFGTFAGSGAEEVFGTWDLNGLSGPIDSADGIFRATQ